MVRTWARDGVVYNAAPCRSWHTHGLIYRARKAAGARWDPDQHPRDKDGKFIERGGTVRLSNGRTGHAVGFSAGRLTVELSTGGTTRVDPRHVTATGEATKRGPNVLARFASEPGRDRKSQRAALQLARERQANVYIAPDTENPGSVVIVDRKPRSGSYWQVAPGGSLSRDPFTYVRGKPGEPTFVDLPRDPKIDRFHELRARAKEAEEAGDPAAAADLYQQARDLLPDSLSTARDSYDRRIAELRGQVSGGSGAGTEPSPPVPKLPDPEPAEDPTPPVPDPAPERQEPHDLPAGVGSMRADVADSQRRAINEFEWDRFDADVPADVRQAAARFRARLPLSAEQAQALIDQLEEEAGRDGAPAARRRALLRATEHLGTIPAHLNGIAAKHVPANRKVTKVGPGEVTEGDTVALPGREGTADIRKVVESRPWYGRHRLIVEDQEGNRETRYVTPDTGMFLLPDLPGGDPVEPEGSGREHLTPDRLRPGDMAEVAGQRGLVVQVEQLPMGYWRVTVIDSGGVETPIRVDSRSGFPNTVRVERGPASKDQPWDSTLPDDDPTPVKVSELRVGDRFIPEGYDAGPGVIEEINKARAGDGTPQRDFVFRTDRGDTFSITLDADDTITRLHAGGDGAEERIARERAQAQAWTTTRFIAARLQGIDRLIQQAVFQDARDGMARLANDDLSWTLTNEALASVAEKRVPQAARNAVSDAELRIAVNAAISYLAPHAHGNETAELRQRLTPLFQEVVDRARDRARDRVVETIRNAQPTRPYDHTKPPEGQDTVPSAAAAALEPLADPNGPIEVPDYASAAAILAQVAPELARPGDDDDAGGGVPDVPELPEGATLADRIAAYREALGGKFGQREVRRRAFKPVSLADLEAGRVPEVEDVTGYVRDRADDGGPGEVWMRHLAILRAAGKDLDAELQRRIAADLPPVDPAEVDRLRRELKEAKEAYQSAESEARDRFAREHGYADFAALTTAYIRARGEDRIVIARLQEQAREAGAIADMEAFGVFRAKSAELSRVNPDSSAWKEKEKELRRKHALAILRSIRPMGGEGPQYQNERGKALTERGQLVKAMRWAEEGYPTEWLRHLQGSAFTLKKTSRGYYSHGRRTIALSNETEPWDGAVPSARVADHELGHGMERVVPGLLAAQEALLWDRTSSGAVGGRSRERLVPIYSGTDEVGYKDEFPLHYTGKDYGGTAWEVFTTAKESLTAGSEYLDDDLRQWTLGVLALL